MSKASLNTEADKMARNGLSVMYKKEKMRAAVKEALLDHEMKSALNEYVFGGDPDAINPLKEIRAPWQK